MRNVRYALLLFCLPLSRVEFKKSKSSVKRTFELATTKVHTNHYIQNLKIRRNSRTFLCIMVSKISKYVMGNQNSIAFRVPNNDFCIDWFFKSNFWSKKRQLKFTTWLTWNVINHISRQRQISKKNLPIVNLICHQFCTFIMLESPAQPLNWLYLGLVCQSKERTDILPTCAEMSSDRWFT